MVKGKGIKFERYFSKEGKNPDEYFNWIKRDSEIKNIDEKRLIYSGRNLEFPNFWSPLAAKIVGSKYFYTGDDKNNPVETSLKQLVYRVSDSFYETALKQGILTKREADIFKDEISFMLFNQMMSFNSPVWFNVGLFNKYGIRESKNMNSSSHYAVDKNGIATNNIDSYERPQGAACFIQSIDDHMESILEHAKKEGMLFKFGSGTGSNFSTIRGINEPLSGGGVASGSISFLRIYDIIAGRIQSGGKTRRAAKMVILDCDHPDLMRFVLWKVNEERKALHLSANPEWGPKGINDLESEAYKTVDGQNGNNSVRVTDEFMKAALNGGNWDLNFRTAHCFEEKEIPLENYLDDRYLGDKRFVKKLTTKRKVINAKEALEYICRAAFVTGDPGLQFDTTINEWHTCPNSGRIRASNPCSEFMFIDNSACNLASINLMKYLNDNLLFDIESFKKTVQATIIGQETLVDYSSYPSKEIAENSHKFRPLGLGYANIGALLMSKAFPYDSNEGRNYAAAITSLMTAKAYETSADLAKRLGPFKEFKKNREPMLKVIEKHIKATNEIKKFNISGLEDLLYNAEEMWSTALEKGKIYGFRNAQVTLLAPTGTIGFMMDVDCTGIEPLLGLKTTKGLAGGGEIERNDIAQCVINGLKILYPHHENKVSDILKYIDENASIVGAPHLTKSEYPIFATALGDNSISIDGHLKMMSAVQPLLSGSISKTVNLPKNSTIEDVKRTYIDAWKLNLKSISLYVDGAKGIQPVNIFKKAINKKEIEWGQRIKPKTPTERIGWNVDISDISGKGIGYTTGVHIIIGEYDNRSPKDAPVDFFVEFGSSGSPFSSTYTSWAKEASRDRQRGASLEEFIKHHVGATAVTGGRTDHPFIKSCSSIEDFMAKLILLEYLGDTSKCDVKPTPEQMESLRCNVLARRRRNEHFNSRMKFIDTVMNEGKISDIFPLFEDEVKNGLLNMGQTFCNICGHPTILSGANCRKCTNCGEASGCG